MKKYVITLEPEERDLLQQLGRRGKVSARKLIHARILLKADCAEGQSGWSDERIAQALDVHPATVANVRRRFVEEGLTAAQAGRRSGSASDRLGL